MPKYKSKLTTALQEEFTFLKPDESNQSKVTCTICRVTFSVAHGGRSNITQHNESERHIKAKQRIVVNNTTDGFFSNLKKPIPTSQLKIAGQELLLAVQQNIDHHCVQLNVLLSS